MIFDITTPDMVSGCFECKTHASVLSLLGCRCCVVVEHMLCAAEHARVMSPVRLYSNNYYQTRTTHWHVSARERVG